MRCARNSLDKSSLCAPLWNHRPDTTSGGGEPVIIFCEECAVRVFTTGTTGFVGSTSSPLTIQASRERI